MPLVTKNFADIITFTRASTGTYFDSAGVLQSAAVDQPRFDYNPATLAAQGLLIEEQRTNLLLQSGWAGAIGGSPGTAPTSWTIGFGTGANTTLVNSIYGTAEQAVKFDADATERIMYQQTVSVTSGVQYAASVFIEAVSGTIGDAIAVTTGTATATQNTFVTNPSAAGRYTILFTANSTGTVNIRYGIGTTAGVSGTCSVTMSRPQLEAGAFPTSYIPTTTTALTRSQDRAVVSTLAPWFNSVAGTIYAEFAVAQPVSGANQFLARFSDSSYSNAIADNVDATGFVALVTASGGVFDGSAATSGIITANTVNKFAGAYASNDLAASRNGGAVATDNTATIPSGLTRFDLGSDHGGFNNIKAGYLRRITYFPRRLSNAELVSITTP